MTTSDADLSQGTRKEVDLILPSRPSTEGKRYTSFAFWLGEKEWSLLQKRLYDGTIW